MSTFTVQPGARVLWCLRRRKTDVRCVIYPLHMPIEVRVVQEDVAFKSPPIPMRQAS